MHCYELFNVAEGTKLIGGYARSANAFMKDKWDYIDMTKPQDFALFRDGEPAFSFIATKKPC